MMCEIVVSNVSTRCRPRWLVLEVLTHPIASRTHTVLLCNSCIAVNDTAPLTDGLDGASTVCVAKGSMVAQHVTALHRRKMSEAKTQMTMDLDVGKMKGRHGILCHSMGDSERTLPKKSR